MNIESLRNQARRDAQDAMKQGAEAEERASAEKEARKAAPAAANAALDEAETQIYEQLSAR